MSKKAFIAKYVSEVLSVVSGEVEYNTMYKDNLHRFLITSVTLLCATSECLSRHRKWDTVIPCEYTIRLPDTKPLYNCTEIRLAINASTHLIRHFVSTSNVSVITAADDYEWDDSEEDKLVNEIACKGLPMNAQITEVWARGMHVSTVISMSDFSNLIEITVDADLVLVITASFSQNVISEGKYTILSRFWAKYYFGDCLYRKCWRDLWNVLPDEFVFSLEALMHQHNTTGEVLFFRWGYFLPVCLLCFVLLVRSCILLNYDADLQY